jgi:hypothetical protein
MARCRSEAVFLALEARARRLAERAPRTSRSVVGILDASAKCAERRLGSPCDDVAGG